MAHKIKIYQRKYPDNRWSWRAVSKMKDGMEIVYGKATDNGKKSVGVEVFKGPNYVEPFDSNKPSWSRRYPMSKVPKTIKGDVKDLKEAWKNVKWSRKRYVNRN